MSIYSQPPTLVPHRRRNPLTGAWVVCSPHRATRPWLGAQEEVVGDDLPQHDPTCYLCPRTQRANGSTNPDYVHNYFFENDFPALARPLDEANGCANGDDQHPQHPLFQHEPAAGRCLVHCYTARHDRTLAQLPLKELEGVLGAWREAWTSLTSGTPSPILPIDATKFPYVQIFENKGAMMGCSNPHPHAQVWALRHIPTEVATERKHFEEHLAAHGTCMLCEYAQLELQGPRVVHAEEGWLAVVPYWATWPFETLVLPTTHAAHLGDITALQPLARLLRTLLRKYDALFGCSFPYSMGIHQGHGPMHLHFHFYPPLLRSATVRKFLVGFEMMCESQRDLTPETAAERLRTIQVSADD